MHAMRPSIQDFKKIKQTKLAFCEQQNCLSWFLVH